MARKNLSWTPRGDTALLWEFLPSDHSRQTHSFGQALAVLERYPVAEAPLRVLDLGCGTGSSFERFNGDSRPISWIGMDIAESQEVNGRVVKGHPFCTYDGMNLPLKSGTIDLVYSHQVFEHVRKPELLLSEVQRVLKNGGCFVGSTSHLEPYHSRSYWNFTPYGFCSLLKAVGFSSIVVRPGIDGFSLLLRRLLALGKLSGLLESFFIRESPLNVSLEAALRLLRIDVRRRNAVKLLFAGQFCFGAVK
jgi:SAM-dependent methyltransferase